MMKQLLIPTCFISTTSPLIPKQWIHLVPENIFHWQSLPCLLVHQEIHSKLSSDSTLVDVAVESALDIVGTLMSCKRLAISLYTLLQSCVSTKKKHFFFWPQLLPLS